MNPYESNYLGSLGFTPAQQQVAMQRAALANARAQKQAYNRAVRMYQSAVKKGIPATPPVNPFISGPDPAGLPQHPTSPYDPGSTPIVYHPVSGAYTPLSGLGDGFFTEDQDAFNLMVYGAIIGLMLWPKNPSKGAGLGFLGGYVAGKAGLFNIASGV